MERENLFSFRFFSFNFSSRLSTTSFSFFIFRLLFASNAEWWRRDVQNSPPPLFFPFRPDDSLHHFPPSSYRLQASRHTP